MPKRKSDEAPLEDAPLLRKEPSKKTKLYHQPAHSKRERAPDSQSDRSEEPRTKRARKTPTPESPDTGPEVWPSVGFHECEETSNVLNQFCIESSKEAARLIQEALDTASETYDYCQNQLPSPEPSDNDVTESNTREFSIVDPIQAQQSTPNLSRLLSKPRRRKHDATPRRKPPQPPEMDKDGRNKRNKRNKPRHEAPLPVVETFLHSKRSSRRDPKCKLWQLGDDGKACTVSRVR